MASHQSAKVAWCVSGAATSCHQATTHTLGLHCNGVCPSPDAVTFKTAVLGGTQSGMHVYMEFAGNVMQRSQTSIMRCHVMLLFGCWIRLTTMLQMPPQWKPYFHQSSKNRTSEDTSAQADTAFQTSRAACKRSTAAIYVRTHECVSHCFLLHGRFTLGHL
jgi:hypothetical protein